MGRPLPAGLGLALDDERLRPALAASLAPRLGAHAHIRGLKSSILKRRTVRYELALEEPETRLCLIGKVYESPAAGQRAFDTLRWLGAQGFAAPAHTVAVPRALAYLPEFALLVMEEAGGVSLQRLLKDGRASAEHARRFALALHELHAVPAKFGPPFTLHDHLRVRCADLAHELPRAFPELARPLERLLADAHRAEQGELAPECTLAHGDYHPGQVHLDGERLWLLDLDPLHQGNPTYDLAMAHASFARWERGPSAPLRTSFLATYFERADPRRAARMPLDLALIHLKRACKRFRWQDEDGWPDAVRREIALADRCLDWQRAVQPPRTAADVLALCAGGPLAAD